MPALTDHRRQARDDLARRLADEFLSFPSDTVDRCVADVLACVTHLGIDATPALVERMAREHLVGMVKSEPPSGRVPGAWSGPPPRRGAGVDG
ncbi:hypothetical protein [Actinomadura macrotermitis]|uniref:Uncharacterized protein n=1 Tax=Actinomadura macrotermitis TaxID=2585200 RepID=A0A7K0C4H6_9ACTN|nr:hypothetical protein [Actinomadura macrotermitis]MQY08347.1 hypothetical protein [Actinomadura macrotermitis]